MKKEIALLVVFTILVVPLNAVAQTNGYSSEILIGNGVVWDVEIGTNFTLWYTGGGFCVVENDSIMSFEINGIEDDVWGILEIGNVSVQTNNTMLALDLTLGIWPSWLPGLFVKVGQENIQSLNESAFVAAERISGNWMNGTMASQYENITVGQDQYECIVFDYEQDPPGTQVTHLAYSLATGILIQADTSVTFGSIYRLVLSLREVGNPTAVDFTANLGPIIAISGLVGGALLAVIVIAYVKAGRQN
ncbi:MAG: hypothetical protein ACFFBJ_04435 [Promethearchaeota archaeon]